MSLLSIVVLACGCGAPGTYNMLYYVCIVLSVDLRSVDIIRPGPGIHSPSLVNQTIDGT